MSNVSITRAKIDLVQLVTAIEQGREQEIIIERNGLPVARLVPLSPANARKRVGVARGAFVVPDSIDKQNSGVTRLFKGRSRS